VGGLLHAAVNSIRCMLKMYNGFAQVYIYTVLCVHIVCNVYIVGREIVCVQCVSVCVYVTVCVQRVSVCVCVTVCV
jgi:hypothetical protein